jgi:hypothetical protein
LDPCDPLGPEGRVLARIVLPETFELYDAGPDWVLGRELDDLGVEYVRMYGLVRWESRGGSRLHPLKTTAQLARFTLPA